MLSPGISSGKQADITKQQKQVADLEDKRHSLAAAVTAQAKAAMIAQEVEKFQTVSAHTDLLAMSNLQAQAETEKCTLLLTMEIMYLLGACIFYDQRRGKHSLVRGLR